MNDRFERGEELLASGDLALRSGLVEDGVEAYEAALRTFRVPELRLGEAKALKGLARAMLQRGDVAEARRRARQAVETFASLVHFLTANPSAAEPAVLRAARHGETAARVVFAEVLVHIGEDDEAAAQIEAARSAGVEADDPNAASTSAALGRLAVRRGDYVGARRAYEAALDLHARAGNAAGQVSTLLRLAELHRLQNDLQSAEAVLNLALVNVRAAGSPLLEGRVYSAMGALMLQSERVDDAGRCYRQALPLVRGAGDSEVEGFTLLGLGDAEGRADRPGAIDLLVDGVRTLVRIGHQHGVAGGMYRIAEYASRRREHALALVAAESARRLWEQSDPVRGVGLALRLVVKALAGLERWKGAFLAAELRARIAGHLQPNAQAVASWYHARSPRDWIELARAASLAELHVALKREIDAALGPVYLEVEGGPPALDTLEGCAAAVEVVCANMPRPSDELVEATTAYVHDEADTFHESRAKQRVMPPEPPSEADMPRYDDEESR
jgi:tetratricopeptide (TPR) repeat protein